MAYRTTHARSTSWVEQKGPAPVAHYLALHVCKVPAKATADEHIISIYTIKGKAIPSQSQSQPQCSPILGAPDGTVSNPAYATQSHISQTLNELSSSTIITVIQKKRHPPASLPIPNPIHAIRFPHTDRPSLPARLDLSTERRTLLIQPARHRNIERSRITACVPQELRVRRQQTPPRSKGRN